MTTASGTPNAFHRRLALLRVLCRESMAQRELAQITNQELGYQAYELDDERKLRNDIKNDVRALRTWGVEIECKPPDYEYRINSFGDFSPVDLPPADFQTLAFLAETFEPGTPNHEAVQRLLARITGWLPPDARHKFPGVRQFIQINLQRRDSDAIDPKLYAELGAAAGKRFVRFDYIAPGQEDGLPRTHTVQPWRLYFDTWRGHYYLDGYRTEVSGPYGLWKKETWHPYRIGRILPATLEVLAQRLPPEEPRRKRYRIEYKLAPEIARGGQVTAHFDSMVVDPGDADGWVRVAAETTNLFRARQILLSYGAGCVVLGGPEILAEIRRHVAGMASHYGQDE